MQVKILLDYNANLAQIEKEEKTIFLLKTLQQIGVPINDIWTDDIDPNELTTEQRMKINTLLSKFSIQVLDNPGDEMQILVENTKIASWHKPFYKLQKDLTNPDPKKQLFLEMEVNTSSITEEIQTNDE